LEKDIGAIRFVRCIAKEYRVLGIVKEAKDAKIISWINPPAVTLSFMYGSTCTCLPPELGNFATIPNFVPTLIYSIIKSVIGYNRVIYRD
jgi:hypothetical protein